MAKNITYYNLNLVKEKAARIEFGDVTQVKTPRDCYRAFENIFSLSSSPQEKFVMLALDTKNQITGAFTVHIGTTNSSIVNPKDIFQRAILTNASSIIVCHNHPSGNPQPSPEDIDITKRLHECGQILGIDVLDHIIIGDDTYVSMKERMDF